MSIVDNGNDVHVEYQIPDEIKSKIAHSLENYAAFLDV